MPKHKDRKHRKRVLVRALWAKREAEMRGGGVAWWHLFGGEVEGAAQDADGNPGSAWAVWVLGPSGFGPDDPSPMPDDGPDVTIRTKEIEGPLGSTLTHRGSWQHVPSVEEVDAVTPEEYRASSGARTEPIVAEVRHAN